MIIRGSRPEGNFYILDKQISEDRRLSWPARGLLIYLLGKPNHWQVSVPSLVNETRESAKPMGRDAVWNLLRELIEAGYCSRTQGRKPDGTLGEMDYTISESAIDSPLTDLPCTDQPCTAQPGPANPTLVSIEGNQGLKGKQETKVAIAPAPFALPDWINVDHWNAWHSGAKRKKATNEQKQLAVDKLNSWRQAGVDHASALENAAIGGWQGLFKPSAGFGSPRNTSLGRVPNLQPGDIGEIPDAD